MVIGNPNDSNNECNKYLVSTMVLILDGNSEHVAHASRKLGLFGEKKCDL